MGFVTLGIVVFFGISYILGLILTSGDSSGDSNPLCVGMVLLCLIAGVYTWYLSRNDRSKVANSAIQEQKQIQTSKPNTYSSNPQNTTISCRICQHTVSRTAPSCPNCGEVYPGLVSKCQYCGSKNIHIRPKGFNLGKAAAGAVVAGPVGAAGGLHGRKDLEIRCSDCHRTLIIKNYEI
jgi:nitrate/nitrite transporter NarK